jgi:hypothetical protein
MADIFNLRAARKRKRRADAEASASANRVSHGMSAAEKLAGSFERTLGEKRLDGHRRVPDDKRDPQDSEA